MVLRCFFLLVVCLLLCQTVAFAGITERVSVSSTGEEGNGWSYVSWSGDVVSADGRYVVFASAASNLVPGDDNGQFDVFLRDRVAGLTYCVSVTPTDAVGNSFSVNGCISADGRYVAFSSYASNLVPADTNDCSDIFVHDSQTGVTERVSLADSGAEGNALSYSPHMTPDGRYVCFTSQATNLTADAVDGEHVFVRDRLLGTTELLSIDFWGEPTRMRTGHISPDGRFTAMAARDAATPWDMNEVWDVVLRDKLLGTTERVSVTASGGWANEDCSYPSMSADGRFVAFMSWADNVVADDLNGCTDIFVRDRHLGTTERVSVDASGTGANADCWYPSISADGRFIAFCSGADDLVPGHAGWVADIFVRDMAAQTNQLVSVSTSGVQGDGHSGYEEQWGWGALGISGDARYVVFQSEATNLVADDRNGCQDIFIRDRETFGDIPVGHWGYYAIDACCDSGLVAGYPDGSYRPDWAVTRDQMAVYISRGLAGGDDAVPAGPAEPTFPDVPSIHWAFDHIEYAVENSIVEGYEDGRYQPDLEVTRGQMAAFIARAIADPTGEEGLTDYQPPEVPSYPDVPADYWSYTHVEYLAEREVVQGYPDGTYRPTATVTRDQMAVYIARAFGLM